MRKLICVLFYLVDICIAHAQPEAFPSTYEAPAGQVLFVNATILTGDGRLDETDLYIAEGQIQWIGQGDDRF